MTDKSTSTEPPAPSAKELELQSKLEQMQKDLEAARKPASRRQPAPPAQPPAQMTAQEQLQAFANEKAREVEVLRTAAQYGLTEDELLADNVEFSNPTELRLHAAMKAQEKKSKALDDTLTEQKKILDDLKKGKEDTSDERSDAGGRTRRVASEAKAAELRTEAQKKGRTMDGRYTLLESIRRDPTKRMEQSKFDDE